MNDSSRLPTAARSLLGFLAAAVLAVFTLWACHLEKDPLSSGADTKLSFTHIADSLAGAGYDSIRIIVSGSGLAQPQTLYTGPLGPGKSVGNLQLPEALGDTFSVTVKAWETEVPGRLFTKDYPVSSGTVQSGVITVVPGTPLVSAPSGVSILPGSLTLAEAGDTATLKATVLPAAAPQGVRWHSSNPSVATVDSAGLVRSAAVGKAVVTATSLADTSKFRSIEVTVAKLAVVDSVIIVQTAVKAYVGGPTIRLEARLKPADATALLSWRSSDPAVAEVAADGQVTGRMAGVARVSAHYRGDESKSDTCVVTVVKDVPVLDVGQDVSVALGATVNFNPKVTQEFGGIVEFKWSLDGDTAWDQISDSVPSGLSRQYTQAGDIYAYFSARDGEGNVATAKRLVRVGSAAPLVVIDSPADKSLVNTTSITVAYKVNNVSLTRMVNLAEGPNTITVDTTINGARGSATITVSLDTRKPVVVITAPADGILTNLASLTVAWTVDGVAQTALVNSLPLEGENVIVREATDAAGNKGADTIKVIRDTRPPLVVITSPGAGTITNLAVIPVAWTVDGVAQTAQLTQDLPAEGEHTIRRIATDAAGNKDTAEVKVIRNSQATQVVITSPVNGFVTNLRSVPVAWTVDGVAQTTQLTQALNVEGENTITREATNSAGTKGSASIKVIRDTLAPKVIITSPANGLVTTASSVTVAWTVDGVAQTAQLTHALTADGESTILREATDAAGNKGSASIKVTRDTQGPTAPQVTGTSPSTDPTPTWSWTSGGGGGNGTFRHRLDNSDLTTGATTTTTLTFTPTSNLSDGSHTLYIQERDAAGNWSASKSHVIQIDATLPTVAITSPVSAPTYLTNKASLFFSGTAADAGGLASVTYQLSGVTTSPVQTVTGTTAWNFTSPNLNDGVTTVTVTAKDAVGNDRSATLTVTRRANVVFVKAGASGGDGSNWDNAFKNLPEALASISSGEIWVAQGTYKPTTGTDRAVAFNTKANVNLYGGFAGTETARANNRNSTATPSILSGEIGGSGLGDNSQAIVTIGNNTVLDGFTIRSATGEFGGAVRVNGSPTISNCIIRDNSAIYGAGVTISGGNPVFFNCLFIDNAAENAADVFTEGLMTAEFRNCTFWQSSTSAGNSFYSAGDSFPGFHTLTIRNCIIWAGSANSAINLGIATLNISHTIMRKGLEGIYIYDGANAIVNADAATISSGDPRFVSGSNLHLQSGSAAINVGMPSAAPLLDIEGRSRPQGGAPDLGAYEF